MDLPPWLLQGINSYGYWVVLLAVAIESTGIPFPGETTLVAAATGAILGDNAGYTIGRYGGYPLLRRILHLLHIGEDKWLYTQRYFAKHGDKTVFFGRFLAVLRAWAAFLAGANHMPRRVFILWNAAGGILWATIYGLLGFILGNNLPLLGRILKGLGIFGFVVVGVIVVAAIALWLLRRRRERAKLRRFATTQDATADADTSVAPSPTRNQRATARPNTTRPQYFRRSRHARRQRARRS